MEVKKKEGKRREGRRRRETICLASMPLQSGLGGGPYGGLLKGRNHQRRKNSETLGSLPQKNRAKKKVEWTACPLREARPGRWPWGSGQYPKRDEKSEWRGNRRVQKTSKGNSNECGGVTSPLRKVRRN